MIVNLDRAASGRGFNPAAIHEGGRKAQEKIEECRARVAALINAEPDEIYFTSGGTESNNWALKGAAFARQHMGNRIITTQIEHPSVLNACKWLEFQGFEVIYLPVDSEGTIDFDALDEACKQGTILVSVGLLNGEIGTWQHAGMIASYAHDQCVDALFHSDCVQAAAVEKLNVKDDELDLASFAGHKFGAPVGTGFLYIKKGVEIDPLLHGGHQQRGLRAGTESLELIEQMTNAFEAHCSSETDVISRQSKTAHLRDFLYHRLKVSFPDIKLNGLSLDYRSEGNLNICIPGVDGEALTMMLSQRGVYISRGSACSSGEYKPSHVLKAIGLSDEDAMSSVRLSLSYHLTNAEVAYAVSQIKVCIEKLRKMGGYAA